MVTRIGKVTKVYPGEGRVKVTFEDSGSSSAASGSAHYE